MTPFFAEIEATFHTRGAGFWNIIFNHVHCTCIVTNTILHTHISLQAVPHILNCWENLHTVHTHTTSWSRQAG
jgi:hypothetical protein